MGITIEAGLGNTVNINLELSMFRTIHLWLADNGKILGRHVYSYSCRGLLINDRRATNTEVEMVFKAISTGI